MSGGAAFRMFSACWWASVSGANLAGNSGVSPSRGPPSTRGMIEAPPTTPRRAPLACAAGSRSATAAGRPPSGVTAGRAQTMASALAVTDVRNAGSCTLPVTEATCAGRSVLPDRDTAVTSCPRAATSRTIALPTYPVPKTTIFMVTAPDGCGCSAGPFLLVNLETEAAGAGSEGDDAPQVAAVAHVVVADVDLVEAVGTGYQFLELQLAAAVQLEEAGDVGARVGRAEQRTADLLLVRGELQGAHRHLRLGRWVQVGHDDATALADQAEARADLGSFADAHRVHAYLRHAPPGQVGHQRAGLLVGSDRVGGAEFKGLVPLERHRVDPDALLGAERHRGLHRVDADAAHPDHHDHVA